MAERSDAMEREWHMAKSKKDLKKNVEKREKQLKKAKKALKKA